MKTVSSLTPKEIQEIKTKGESFLSKHSIHVLTVINNGPKYIVPPSGVDLFRPELWKAIHWRWFSQWTGVALPDEPAKKKTLWDRINIFK